MGCAFGVDGDGAHFSAVDGLAGVAVADRGSSGRAALLGLLSHTLNGLGGEVVGVELRDPRHDRLEQLARWGGVDVFGDRDELGAGLADGEADGDVVGAVSGVAVDLVDDDVVDVAFGLEPREHCLELWPVRGLGGLAPVDVLLNDDGAEALGLAEACVALRGD
ncbi:MAG: hypothetical protein WBD02_01585 [Acidimicrobiia bacterium]